MEKIGTDGNAKLRPKWNTSDTSHFAPKIQSSDPADKLTLESAKQPQPELHLRPDRAAKYAVVAEVMAAAQRLGMTKIGIVGSEQFLEQ